MTSANVDTSKTRRALRSLLGGFHQAALYAVDQGARAAEANAKRTTLFKDDTGELRSSIRRVGAPKFYSGRAEARVAATARHAVFVEHGTRPHIIAARRAPYLRFQVNGSWVSKKMVRHPGTKPTAFMAIAGHDAEREFDWALSVAVEDAIARFER